MKILVATIGSRGDVQPYINLCQGLQEAGHDVSLATNPTLCPLVAAHGVRCTPVGPAVDMGAEGARLMGQSFNNMWIGMIRVMQLGARLVEQAYPDVLEACKGVDLVITTDTTSGVAEAEKMGLPWISVTLQPARVPVQKATPSLITRLVWGVLGKLFILPINRSRKRLGAPLVTDISTMLSKRLILLPVSRHVAPPDPLWPTYVRQTGYWFARPQGDWAPPQDLLEFLDAGNRPIVVSLGVMSMSGRPAHQGAQIVLEAIRRTGVRAIVQGWDEALRGVDLPPTVYHAGSMPHSWLFAQGAAIVHHGGFGTTSAALRAGAPGLIIPHVIDQFYWGQRVSELGVGPQFISRGKLSPANLSKAITEALSDRQMQAKAAALAGCIDAEPDGVKVAVSIIEKML
jgi:sterol 3beta-glucosyltransferase